MQEFVQEILISDAQIQQRVSELGAQISLDYAGKEILLLCILKGGVIFLADLAKSITVPLEMDFMAVSSYGSATHSSGVVKIVKDLEESIEGKHVLIVEDIIDTGLTLKYLIENLKQRQPASLKIVALFDKPDNRAVDILVDYSGFIIPNKFIVGYGLDYRQFYRNVPYIFVPNPEKDPRDR
ncbi:MAG: hypoxanthine phosphoribosyltransferase [Peptococcaceae bacterium]|nr:hypoxanthine phosphoribosyltransferase [Peptococcaceae bacterium]